MRKTRCGIAPALWASTRTACPSLLVSSSSCFSTSSARQAGVSYDSRPYPYTTPLSPAVSVLLERHHLKPEQITPSGPKRRILKADVLTYLSKKPEAPPVAAPPVNPIQVPRSTVPLSDLGLFEDIPNSNVRRVIASRLTESKRTVPHSYVTAECRIDSLMNVRAELNARERVKVSLNDFVIRALALALRDVPAANAVWQEDGAKLLKGVDISVAVATPKGLFTPVVKNAHEKGVLAISEEVKALAARAKEGKLKPEEYQGGTASVSNLGMFGIDNFSAVLNPPQACILAVGQGKKVLVAPDDGILFEPVPPEEVSANSEEKEEEVGAATSQGQQEAGEEKSELQEGEAEAEAEPQLRLRAKVVTSMAVSLSCDSRVVDEETAAMVLERFQYFLERPENILV